MTGPPSSAAPFRDRREAPRQPATGVLPVLTEGNVLMTAVSGDLLTARNATIDDLVVLLRDQQARKVDVVASASSVRAEGGCLVLDGTMPVLGADVKRMRALGIDRPSIGSFDSPPAGAIGCWIATGGRGFADWLEQAGLRVPAVHPHMFGITFASDQFCPTMASRVT